MKTVRRFVDVVLDHSKLAVLAMVLLTVLVGAGAPQVSQSSSLDQFQTDSPAADKLDYIQTNFTTGEENTTTAQIIVRGDGTNVLSKSALLDVLAYESALRDNETIAATLAGGADPIVGIPDVLATSAVIQKQVRELETKAATLQHRRAALEANRSALQARSDELNATAADLRAALTQLRADRDASIQAAFETVRANTTVTLDQTDVGTFRQAAQSLRNATSQAAAQQAYRLGTRGVLSDEYAAVEDRANALRAAAADLQALVAEVQALQADLENGTTLTHGETVAQIESMNASELDAVIRQVLSADGSGNQRVFGFMPTGYQTGSTEASATMLIVRQTTDGGSAVQGSAGEPIVDAQLAIQTLGETQDAGVSYLIFGGGVITHEINSSMTDSLLIVGPLALLFVLVALVVAYRDLFDIVLGLLGIGTVLIWTFGFMGWADIAFNQLFVAVPVLLIGLSIDYAIHIFMRHREERQSDGEGSRGSMRIGLAGVGIALIWVTATTVIGFLSNLTSPVPPIQEFGVVSAFGITAALLVFGILVPAVKVELDELLEGFGLDRRKRAFGTGGGRFSRVLGVGETLARKAPYAVILVTLVITAAGAYGGAQVDTSFAQEDFLADEPPGWMKDLPEPFAPSEYSAKENLGYVNENFVREDSQAQILIEGAISDPDVLDRVADAADLAAEKGVTQELSNGEPDITGPLRTMRQVAAQNSSFNETFRAADTNGDGVPDQDLEGVYNALFATAPAEARNVVHRTDGGEYAALRLIISVKGGASGDAITTQMRDVADSLDGSGLQATATGQAILNKVVQDQLLETVIQSLLITLAAIFLFLMVAYRLTEGSATLGIVTLVPVALTVAWILGTMYALGIPFNVLTGTITSLTVGLGVAYGIHISERYNQELERNGSVWAAMRTTVTGTGGALLGSAATTVGGFGVLYFAILPPLKQFGLITGITIIYAFLTSVLVLPSLLAVWTRFVQPEAVADMTFPADEDAGGTDVHDGATRSIEYGHVRPGQELEVAVSVEDVQGRVFVEEVVEGAVPVLESTWPDAIDAVARDDHVYAAWELDGGTARLTYSVTVPETATDGEEIQFDGRIHAAEEADPVAGVVTATVVTDLFERVLARGIVTDDDLRLAEEEYAAGILTERQYERIHREWVRGDGAEDADEA